MCYLSCSPPSARFASFTLPILPAPMVLPSIQVPDCAGIVVRLLLVEVPPCDTILSTPSITAIAGAPLVPASDVYRECDGLDERRWWFEVAPAGSVRAGAVEACAVSRGSVRRGVVRMGLDVS